MQGVVHSLGLPRLAPKVSAQSHAEFSPFWLGVPLYSVATVLTIPIVRVWGVRALRQKGFYEYANSTTSLLNQVVISPSFSHLRCSLPLPPALCHPARWLENSRTLVILLEICRLLIAEVRLNFLPYCTDTRLRPRPNSCK